MIVIMKNRKVVLFAGLIAAAVILRWFLFPKINSDLGYFLIPWYTYISEHGGFFALRNPFYNYSPPYLYFLVAATTLHGVLPAITAIKLISVCFDFLCSWLLFKLLRIKYPAGVIPYAGFLIVLFTPTVFINSALWGQCDVIYSSFLLACIYFCIKQKYPLALVCFATAFAFKAQSIFLSPLILIFILKRVFSLRYLLLLPVTFLAWMLPSLLVGYPISSILGTYLNQASYYHELSMNAPNIYALIPNAYYDIVVPIGAGIAFVVCLIFVWIAASNRVQPDPNHIFFLSLFFTFLMPFILPKMHDRYFYTAALLAVGYAFYQPKFRIVPFALQASSVISYLYFLREARKSSRALLLFAKHLLDGSRNYLFF